MGSQKPKVTTSTTKNRSGPPIVRYFAQSEVTLRPFVYKKLIFPFLLFFA